MSINWGLDYPYGYLDNEPITPKTKPEPEPNWRSMYYGMKDERDSLEARHKALWKLVNKVKKELDEARSV
jgi:hypothetical protein